METSGGTLRQQGALGPFNDLHRAARAGSIGGTIGVLASGSIDIDQRDPEGWTPLMFASSNNYPSVVRLLLNKGANLSLSSIDGSSFFSTTGTPRRDELAGGGWGRP